MKKVNIFALMFVAGVSAYAFAQIPGAVGFKAEEAPSAEQVQNEKPLKEEKTSSKADATALLAEKIKKQRMWDNPRFSKKIYGNLKGMQDSIEKAQNKELEKKEFASEEEKAKALEKMKTQAIVHFEDFSESPEQVHQKMNENPRNAVIDMTKRLDYIEQDKLTDDFSNYVQDEMQNQFIQRNGVTMDEYQNASRQQMQEAYEQRLAEKDKSDTFPPLTNDSQVKVEKVDEQNALLHISVGAPVSKKK